MMMVMPAQAQYRGYNSRYGRTTYNRPASRNYGSAPYTYYGFRVGVNGATVNSDDQFLDGSSMQSGLNVGFNVGVLLTSTTPLFFETGLQYTEKGGKGSVTTYGSVTDKETSLGGACNYGQTNIQYYAAIHVNVSPGDDKGPWNGGAACGGCVRVKAKTPDGWKRVTVRITDRCPDANCGVDLGGAPAADIMGNRVGRYYGEWEFVSCEGVEGVWGDSTSLWVKEGASSFWSIVQVRNPKDMVNSITIYEANAGKSYELEMVVGTENFWTVPPEVLQTENRYRVVVKYRTGTDDEWIVKGSELAVGEANLYLYEHRE